MAGSRSRPVIDVVSAKISEQPLLAKLLASYAREFSELHPVRFEADGSFVYPQLAEYWLKPGRFPFLVQTDGAVAGFVLVTRVEPPSTEGPVFDIAEFFVTGAFRRQGAGTTAAHIVWRRFPALWQVRVLEANQPALRFWESAIGQFTGTAVPSTSFSVGDELWRRFSFDSRTEMSLS